MAGCLTLTQVVGVQLPPSQLNQPHDPGGRSSTGRVPGCGPGGCGFKPHRSPCWAIVAELAYARDLNSRFLWVRLPPVASACGSILL